MPLRIVIDTNVFIAALLSDAGENRKVLRLALEGKVLPVFGNALFSEYQDVMSRPRLTAKSPLTAEEQQTLLEALLSVSDWVRVYFLWRPNLPDEGDNHLIELALAGDATHIVTNNIRDFRSGELTFPKLKIVTPSEFTTLLKPS
jgi:uncharacterized protein